MPSNRTLQEDILFPGLKAGSLQDNQETGPYKSLLTPIPPLLLNI